MQDIANIPARESERRGVAYRSFGRTDGNVILVWHVGWFTSMTTTWRFLPAMHTLADKFHCLIYDRAGVGESAHLPGRAIPDRALDAADVVRDCLGNRMQGIKDFHIAHIGVSEGGTTALEFGALFREYTDALVLVGTTPTWMQSGDWKYGLDSRRRNTLGRLLLDSTIPLEKRMARWLDLMFGRRAVPPEFASCLASDIHGDEAAMEEILKALLGYDGRRNLKSIQVPALILHGQKDEIDVGCARAMGATMECAQLHVYRGCRHGVWWRENEAQFASDVENFIKKLVCDNWSCPSSLPYINVTAHPWRARKDFLRDIAKTVDPDSCAVMLPAKPKKQWNKVFEAVSLAAGQNGMVASRVVDMHAPSNIPEDAWSLISRSSTVVVDVSAMNPNVIYELGVCDTWGKTVFVVADRRTMLRRLPIYLSHKRLIRYDYNKGGLAKLAEDLTNHLRANRELRGLDLSE